MTVAAVTARRSGAAPELATARGAATTADAREPPRRFARRRPDPDAIGVPSWRNALFVAPFMAVVALLVLLPLALGAWLSFQDYDMLSGYGGFVGVRNYVDLWNDRIFIRSVWNTIVFVGLTMPAFIVLGLALALALNNAWRTSVVLRSVFFATSVLSVTIVTLIWRLVYMPDRGLLSNLLAPLGVPSPPVITSEWWALPGIAVVSVWWAIGFPMILFLAALQQIPRDVYEAAALDNASRWQVLTRITLPAIRRTTAVVAVLEVVRQFQVFGQVQLITNGGPNNASRPIVMFIYEAGFRDWALGYAAAASQVLFLLMLAVAVWQVRLLLPPPAKAQP
jgi:multiple sugar transport system permease protein